MIFYTYYTRRNRSSVNKLCVPTRVKCMYHTKHSWFKSQKHSALLISTDVYIESLSYFIDNIEIDTAAENRLLGDNSSQKVSRLKDLENMIEDSIKCLPAKNRHFIQARLTSWRNQEGNLFNDTFLFKSLEIWVINIMSNPHYHTLTPSCAGTVMHSHSHALTPSYVPFMQNRTTRLYHL